MLLEKRNCSECVNEEFFNKIFTTIFLRYYRSSRVAILRRLSHNIKNNERAIACIIFLKCFSYSQSALPTMQRYLPNTFEQICSHSCNIFIVNAFAG